MVSAPLKIAVHRKSRQSSLVCALLLAFLASSGWAAEPTDYFRPLDERFPTPNSMRLPTGHPGRDYWQQRVDYDIEVSLNEKARSIKGRERITYHNQSPDTLPYLWLQLDQNMHRPDSKGSLSTTAPNLDGMSYNGFDQLLYGSSFKGGFRIQKVIGGDGRPLKHRIVDTMMRVDLPAPLASGERFHLEIEWNFPIIDAKRDYVRMGFEHFEEDGNDIFTIAQWFPRLCAYTDVHGWQNHHYIGSEFTLEFGDYHVQITVPEDHVVASTGELQNPDEVLSEIQQERLKKARGSKDPVMIVTLDEAKEKEKHRAKGTRTWEFRAENVRDFAFATSRKFLWDAMGKKVGGRTVLAMSYWPKEGEPLWSRYSTRAVAHTIDVYGRHAFPYPYPVAISVNGPIYGMEYPMICFQSPRPEKDGTYSSRTKYGLISVIIHEVGHNWFPMIVNSDERRWRWMDEGLNSFLQYLAEAAWEAEYPTRITEPSRKKGLYGYLASDFKRPIMAHSDSLISGGYNAYTKPTLALNILRETILGRRLFDDAFREYSQAWQFKRPTPYDFFRVMEESSGVDLDWFWAGWFFGTDHTDQALRGVTRMVLDTRNPEVEKLRQKKEEDKQPESVSDQRNEKLRRLVDIHPDLKDFYNDYDPLEVTASDKTDYEKLLKKLDEKERRLLETPGFFYVAQVENVGGLPMPVILKLTHADGSVSTRRHPAEIWRRSSGTISLLVRSDKEVLRFELDPQDETADTDRSNNVYPPEIAEKTFRLNKPAEAGNPMRKAQEDAKKLEKEKEEKSKAAAKNDPKEPGQSKEQGKKP